MLEDNAVRGSLPDPAGPAAALKIPVHPAGDLPAPDPGVVESARLRLAAHRVLAAGRHAGQAAARPAGDILAISAVIGSARGGAARPADALDVRAALVVLCDLRLHLDGLEAGLLDAALQVDLGWDVVAAIIGIPADEAQHRRRALRARQTAQ
jgi:hypothetical protein